ncbi:FtsX-like permease family protein [Parapedobacter pyrenivorans]|uniref:FtsX-like permease family protein n=1 Tax=Parapedobacter pyrenivorans TaxID=1305674 RepID=UPI00333F2BBF
MMHNIKIAFRTLLKGRLYSAINILGLTLGIASCLVIGTVVFDELSYDKHWSRSADTYRLLSIREGGGAYSQKGGTVYAGLAPALKQQFPEVEDYSEIYPVHAHVKINKTDPAPLEVTMLHADTTALRLLDISLLAREDITPTNHVNKIIVSESFSKVHFTGHPPLGQQIYDVPNFGETPKQYEVAGVMKDIPPNTHLRADIILLKERQEEMLGKNGDGAGMRYARHYILLQEGTDPQQFEQKLNNWYAQSTENDKTRFALQPMADIYLKTDFPAYQFVKGNIRHSYIFGAVGILLMVIASINYINLSTAHASSRLKETGVQKILGASRARILLQSLLESLLIFGLAGCLAWVCYQLTFPALERFIGHSLAFSFTSAGPYPIYALIAFFSVCLFSGLYPAWLVSGFRTVGSMQQTLKAGKANRGWLRKSLVVVQFAISIVILASMLVVQQQVDFLKTKDIGFDSEGLISVDYVSWDNKSQTLRAELLKNPDILSLSFSGWLPSDGAGPMMKSVTDPSDPNKKIELWYIDGEPNIAQTLGLRLKEGRFLDPDIAGDAIPADDFKAMESLRPCLMTASTARLLQIEGVNQPLHEAGIIPVGIIEDFNSESLHKQAVPTVIVGYRDPAYGGLLIRTRPNTESSVMRAIAKAWKEVYPDKLFEIQIVKEKLAMQYAAEEKLQGLFRMFSLLTMLLAALGILGLIVHTLGLRVKEIGIRKVLGATVTAIVAMLAKDFVKLVLLAAIIASPIAWWAMNKWLEDFAYRIDIQWWMFVAAGLAAVVIAVLTVSWQAIRAAMANPVDSLRNE